jgi:hypothetical protein|tara:strand:- start:4145 stop:4837 length:693 start_codon:yes stop_codon:yes gene_type:complete
MKAVTLLCRGDSLGHISSVPKVNHSVIVNGFHYEAEDTFIDEYLSASSNVTHVLSLAAYFPQSGAAELYKKYNFDKIILPYVKEVSPPIPNHFLQIEGRDGILPVENLDDINKKDMISHPRYAYTSPSSGLDALLYIVNQLKPDEVNIIGMDFYENIGIVGTGYFTNSIGKERNDHGNNELANRHDPTDLMQDFFKKVVTKKSNIKFNMYTASNFEFEVDNLKITKLNSF